jgi:hypothetical protein
MTDQYRYPILRWVFSPDTTGDVFRTSQYTVSASTDDSFVRVVSSGARFRGVDFSAAGYNNPIATEISLTAREIPDVEGADQRLSLSQQFAGPKTDSWFRSNETGFEFDGETVDCARVLVSFVPARVEVYTSNGIDSRAEGFCGTKEIADKTFSAQPVPRRQ